MDPISLLAAGFVVGVVRERLYKASDRDLGVLDTLECIGRGFTREAESLLGLLGKKKEKRETLVITVPADLKGEQLFQALAKKMRRKMDLPMEEEDIVIIQKAKKPRRKKKKATTKAKATKFNPAAA